MNKNYLRIYLGDLIEPDPDYTDEPILPRKKTPEEKLPAPLQAARSLEKGAARMYQNRRSLFLNQAKLLEFYKDDYEGEYISHCYYPTYDLLSNRELRSYFAWRTKVRNGDIQPSCSCFAYLYLYELINGIGTGTPVEGLHKMDDFAAAYKEYESSLMNYYANWRKSYIIYYNLSDSFLGGEEREGEEAHMAVLDSAQEQTDDAIAAAVKQLAPGWLNRSKFYKTHQTDMDRVIVRVLRRMHQHYSTRSKRTFSEQLFGSRETYPVDLFCCAVFCDPLRHENSRYYITDSHYYECRSGYWTETSCFIDSHKRRKLEDLIKTIDASLRVALNDGKPIKSPPQLKWVTKVIEEEVAALLREKEQQEAASKRVQIDYSALAQIRREAAITQEKLATEEEMEEEVPPAVQPPPPQPEALPGDCPLDKTQYRLMQNLLYGGDTSWVQREGKMVSVLLDSINEILYETFQDAVIEDGQVVEGYIDELKEMVKP